MGIEMGMGMERELKCIRPTIHFINPETHDRGLTLPYTYKMRCNVLILSCFIPEKRDTPPATLAIGGGLYSSNYFLIFFLKIFF